MKFTKLNDDNSWLWEFDSYSLLVDPWFTPQQVDLAPWFSTQRHVTRQPKVIELPSFDAILFLIPLAIIVIKKHYCSFRRLLPLSLPLLF
jgi:hypothetical protein